MFVALVGPRDFGLGAWVRRITADTAFRLGKYFGNGSKNLQRCNFCLLLPLLTYRVNYPEFRFKGDRNGMERGTGNQMAARNAAGRKKKTENAAQLPEHPRFAGAAF